MKSQRTHRGPETNGRAPELNGQVKHRQNGDTPKEQNGFHEGRKEGVVNGSTPGQWGRAWKVDILSMAGCLFLLIVCPFLPVVFYSSCSQNQCSLSDTLQEILTKPSISMVTNILSLITMETVQLYVSWLAFQIFLNLLPDVLHRLIPSYVGGIRNGAVTPAGYVNPYNINGMQAWLITHLLWFLNAFYFQFFSPSIISRNIGGFILLVNVFGYALAGFAFLKGHLFPTHAEDCKFSGSFLYDYLMGIEFNPRIGKYFDFKLFFNGRPGIVCWTLINSSYAFHQWEKFGYVTDSMILVNVLQAVYVVDFFWNEAWYLKTIDICHDHFGWYLAWGDLVWLPVMYTLQGFYLTYNPIHLGTMKLLLILSLGMIGYVMFRSANCQKDHFRADPANCKIWGKKATYIRCSFVSSDGRKHNSTLLTSGWWGIGRHMNYTGDLFGSLAYCLCCGTDHIFPYFYIIYMLILLVHRIYRDEHRCQAKYGEKWKEYTNAVPCRLIPGVY